MATVLNEYLSSSGGKFREQDDFIQSTNLGQPPTTPACLLVIGDFGGLPGGRPAGRGAARHDIIASRKADPGGCHRGPRAGESLFRRDLLSGLFSLSMRISEAYGPGKFGLSFELFPPKTPAGEQEMFRHLEHLMAFRPSYVTCTYGAGGSTRDKTLDIVDRGAAAVRRAVASHLTCVGSTVDELRAYLARSGRGAGSTTSWPCVAIRRGERRAFGPSPADCATPANWSALVRGEFPQFGIAVAGYPETHQEAASPEADLENLRRKVEAGGDIVITQLFYVNDDFFRFRDRCAAVWASTCRSCPAFCRSPISRRSSASRRCAAPICRPLSQAPDAPKTMPIANSRPASLSPSGRFRSWSMPASRAFTSTC